MNTNATPKNSTRLALLAWIIIAIACAIRLLHVLFTQRYNPLASDLQLDAATYDRWARALAFGGDPGPTTLMQAPLYPWFLSLIYRIFGPNLAAVRTVQALIGTATCGLVMFSTLRFFKSAVAAVLAGLFAALYAPLIFYEGTLLPATLIVFLNALAVAVVFSEGRPGAQRVLASGIVLGIAGTANPPTLLLVPFAALHLHFTARSMDESRLREGPLSPRFRHFLEGVGLLVLGVAIAIAPVIVRNALRTGEFIPLTTGAGINFYLGNNPGANGFYRVPVYRGVSLGGTPEEQAHDMASVASNESGRTLSQAEVSHFWFEAGLDFIRRHPGAWSRLLWKKFQFFWNRYERANVESFYFHRRFPGVLGLPLVTFGFLAPLALLGMFLTRYRWKELWVLYGGVLTYLSTALTFYVLARYRLPVVAFLLPFAGAAVVELYSLARWRRVAELALSLFALAILAFFSNMPVAKDTPAGIADYYARLGNVCVVRRDWTGAERAYREALNLDSGNEVAKRGLEIARDRLGKAHR